jgi:hypothetical protein
MSVKLGRIVFRFIRGRVVAIRADLVSGEALLGGQSAKLNKQLKLLRQAGIKPHHMSKIKPRSFPDILKKLQSRRVKKEWFKHRVTSLKSTINKFENNSGLIGQSKKLFSEPLKQKIMDIERKKMLVRKFKTFKKG